MNKTKKKGFLSRIISSRIFQVFPSACSATLIRLLKEAK